MDPFAKKFEPDDPRFYEGNVFMKIDILDDKADYVVEEMGRIEIELRYDVVPLSARNFRSLATREKGYGYIGTRFFRILTGFMVQGGDVTNNNGFGGKSIYGYRFDDENFDLSHDAPGVVSMANGGRNRNNSQFFILTTPAEWLDGKHVVVGKVVKGFDVIKRLETFSKGSTGAATKIVEVTNCGVIGPNGEDLDSEPASEYGIGAAGLLKASERDLAKRKKEEAEKEAREEEARKAREAKRAAEGKGDAESPSAEGASGPSTSAGGASGPSTSTGGATGPSTSTGGATGPSTSTGGATGPSTSTGGATGP